MYSRIMTDDMELVREYAARQTESAFATLVSRHVNLVYSTALRQTRDNHLAEEITQAVFIVLARKAGSLGPKTILPSWLYRTARFATADALKSQRRRQHREQEAFMQSLTESAAPDAAWQELSPLIDEAMDRLGETDRAAIVLRYFENKTLEEVGAALGLGERAAQKRVARGLEKLRASFARRGVTLTTIAIAGAVSTHSTQAAPAGLAALAIANPHGAAVATSTLNLAQGTLKLMAWTKTKIAIAAAAGLLLTAGTTSLVLTAARSGDREGRDILKRMQDRYASLQTYAATGVTVEEVNGKTLTASFSLRLGRPNLYWLEYEQHAPTFTNKAQVWSTGDGDFFKNERVAQPLLKNPIPGPANALGMIADISGGATAIVPETFFGSKMANTSPKQIWDDALKALAVRKTKIIVQPDESVAGVDCHVLTMEIDKGVVTVWIGTEDSLIHQSRQDVKSDSPDATDAEIAALLANVGAKQPPLPPTEMKRRINEARKKAFREMKTVTVVFATNPPAAIAPLKPGSKPVISLLSMTIDPPPRFVYTQTFENITANPPLAKADFDGNAALDPLPQQ